MTEFDEVALPHSDLRGLAWLGDELIAVAGGFSRISLDGGPPKRRYSGYGPAFDAVFVAPAGDVVVLVETSGTKGLVLGRDGNVQREINRSYYHADAYRYPIALFTQSDGTTDLVHCPDAYNRIEIETALTGQRSTTRDGQGPDIFHSRLHVSPDGRYLLSAGWVWHPWSSLFVYDLEKARDDPAELNSQGSLFNLWGLIQAEIGGACFLSDGDIALTTAPEENDPDDEDDLGPNMLARWSPASDSFVWRVRLEQPTGDVLPFDGDLLTLRGHPRLYSSMDGSLIREWPHVDTGDAQCSIVWDKGFSGPARVAIDPQQPRFAVTDGEQVVIVSKRHE